MSGKSGSIGNSSAPARVRLTWLLSPPLARATNDRPAVMFQPSDSYTCSTIPLEHIIIWTDL